MNLPQRKIQQAADCIADGRVVAYPTEAVWGLGCAPGNQQAVYQLLSLKHREAKKGLILIAADMNQIEPYIAGLGAEQKRKLSHSWPGPITWLVPDNGMAPDWITGDFDTLALRITAHPLASELCRVFGGPVVSTSANPQGRPPALDEFTVREYFGDQLGFILPGQLGEEKTPSEIRDLATGNILRTSSPSDLG